ncbi:MAG: ClbS/DfsB family four-helix bundle protein [Nitrolancea sp.]
MSTPRTKAETLDRIEEARRHWISLVDEVGEGRMEQPGPMGDWTFKDLAAHLTAWQERTILRLEAGPGIEVPATYPDGLTVTDPDDPDATDWDPANAWFRDRDKERSVHDVLADAENSWRRVYAAVEALSEGDVVTPGRFSWLGDHALSEADFDGHLTEEHEPAVRAWLAGQNG